MRNIDRDGLILCKMQANIFSSSLQFAECSTEIFIRRFMNSDIVKDFDNLSILNDTIGKEGVFKAIEDEFGKSNFGKNKYNKEVLFWIGYIYRYMAYTYQLSSKQIHKIIKPKELKVLYKVYHTYDCQQAIERIFEDKKVCIDDEAKNSKLLKLIRKNAYEKGVELKPMTKELIYNFFSGYQNDPALFKNPEDFQEYVFDEQSAYDYATNIKSENGVLIAILYKEKVVGEIVFWDIQDSICAMDIILKNDSCKNRGLGSVAIEKGLEFAKKELGIKKIKATMLKSNDRSIHVFKKLGFEYLGEDDDYVQFTRKTV